MLTLPERISVRRTVCRTSRAKSQTKSFLARTASQLPKRGPSVLAQKTDCLFATMTSNGACEHSGGDCSINWKPCTLHGVLLNALNVSFRHMQLGMPARRTPGPLVAGRRHLRRVIRSQPPALVLSLLQGLSTPQSAGTVVIFEESCWFLGCVLTSVPSMGKVVGMPWSILAR